VRIALVLLVVAVVVHVIVRWVQSRFDQDTSEVGRTPTQPDPGAEEAYRRAVRERAERQRRGVPEPESESPHRPAAAAAEPTVVVEPEVFGYDRDFGTCHEAFVVESSSPPVDVIAAVRRANARFMLVDERGTEHASGDALDAAFDAHEGPDDLYTPNYAADPRLTPEGVEGYLDCKGGIEPEMGATLRRVLVEELSRLDRPARVRPRSDG
jgi:hypothetical protein